MNSTQPIFDTATHYRIEVRGRVYVDWLQSFDSSAEVIFTEIGRIKDVTVINVHIDQAGIVGLRAEMRLYPQEVLAIELMSNAPDWDRDRVADAAANMVFSMIGQ
jgi:hypothetical protein